MNIALVTAFPPSRKALNEYGFHIAEQLRQSSGINLTILGDYLSEVEPELPGFRVIRCWGFDRTGNVATLLRAMRSIRPDVAWFNLGFASFGARALPAMLGLATPAVTRFAGCYTHITLHQLFETVDLADAGVTRPNLYAAGGWLATHLLLSANSVSVLLPTYRRTLQSKYRRGRVSTRSHGIFAGTPSAPEWQKRGNPTHRILAFGKWGTYKRLELLIEAFQQIAAVLPDTQLLIAGGDHPKTPGYVAGMAERHASSQIRFLGYIAELDVAELFQSASVAVMPYTSSAGSSGVAHVAAQHGVPIIASDIPDFRELVEHEGLAIEFFKPEDGASLAAKAIQLLTSPSLLTAMAQQNFAAALQMTMPEVVRQYIRSFDRNHRLQVLQGLSKVRGSARWFQRRTSMAVRWAEEVQSWSEPPARKAGPTES